MLISQMKAKSYYKVQLIAKTKTIKITKQEFKTKSEGLEKGISKGYDILNLKAVNKLLCEGWTEYTAKQENVSETIVEAVKPIEVKQEFNTEVEEAIRQNYIKKVEKKGVIMYKGASTPNEYSDDVKRFLNTPPTQPTYKPFDYSKQSERYEKRGRIRAEKALAEQMKEYR